MYLLYTGQVLIFSQYIIVNMLTLSDFGKPIAIVHNGEYDGEIISVVTNPEELEDLDEDDEPYFILDEYDSGVLVPLPNMEGRHVNYTAGPSGSGKSTYASGQMDKFRKINPNGQIYIFSRLDSDPAFDNKFNPKPIRMKIDTSLITNPIDITKQIKGPALVVFDDVDTIMDEKLKKAVMKLENDILEIGRHNNVSIICCSHLINGNDKKFARTIMNEAHTLTVFPSSGSTYQITYCLKNYFGLDKNQIKTILSLPSRWVTIYKGYPQCCVSEKGAYVLSKV